MSLTRTLPPWFRYLAAATAILILVGALWLYTRPTLPPAESSVAVTSIRGDTRQDVIDLWENWWEAWAEVREAASVDDEGRRFSDLPFDGLVTDREVLGGLPSSLFTTEVGGGYIGIGEPTEIRLAPHIDVEDDRAIIRDCLYLNPIPWPRLRTPESTAGTVRYAAEMELTSAGWRISRVQPEPLIVQFAEDSCQPGRD